ncbi:MAG TPA: BBE domain-containing protein [Edaphobacter sp.]
MAIEIVSSGDVRFDRLSRGQNGRYPAKESDRASRIALCDNSDDVAEALERFVHQGLRPTIRSGGNCYEDFVDNNPGGAIIDLSFTGGTQVSPNSGHKYRLGAGSRLGQAYYDLYQRDLVTIPGGTCAPVAAGGHIQGGGYGLLSRLHGVTPDWVSAVDVVTIDSAGKARVRRADKKNDPDLLRACRGGGGGNYGIVTNFYFDDLPKVPKEVIRGSIGFDWKDMTPERFARVLTLYSDYWNTRGRDQDTWGLFTIFGLSHRSSGHLNMGVTFTNVDGTVDNTRVLDEFIAVFDECKPVTQLAVHPTMAEHHPEPANKGTEVCLANHTMNRIPWIDSVVPVSQTRAAATPASRRRHKYKSCYMKQAFTPGEIAAYYKHLTREIPGVDLKGNVILVDSFGGATNKPQMAEETSVAQRGSIMKLQFIATWADESGDAGNSQWIRDLYTDLYPATGARAKYSGTPFWGDRYEGCYINYPDSDMVQHDFWPQLYYGTGDIYPHLQQVKRKFDPNNVFHHAMSVRI